ncbi:MAG TPA: HAMP domain-containing sensor histidine kinase [Steroidobacteraceae bacterium]|nr:HAMP domain-containing sensor histidine kinase [Steroidobacteraceae bacterium]
MLLGVAVIAVPLLVAIFNAALQIQQLADSSRTIASEGIGAARASEDLMSEVLLLERATLQQQVLADPKLLEVYREDHAQLTASRTQLAHQLRTTEGIQALTRLGDLQNRIAADVQGARANTQTVGENFTEMSILAQRIAVLSKAQIDAQIAGIQRRTSRSQRLLLWQSGLLIPLGVFAIVVLTFGVGQPLRRIDRAISELGRGNLSHPISVSGPKDIERLARQLEWLRGRLLDFAAERNRFLRHMSHELKTPLANIREGTELLMDGAVGELDTNQREVTGILRENGLKLQRLIENLLSFSAWQTSSVGLETSEFRLRPLVKQVLENQQLTLLGQRVRLEVKIEDVTLNADRGKVRLILDNLLSNAIKYSPKGGAIYLSATADANQLMMDVADAGPGIPYDERAHIFEAFYTGKAARGVSVKGTGIGLSVVLEFVAAHGGTVQIVDGQFPGAHFRITMPLFCQGTQSAGGSGPAGPARIDGPGGSKAQANAA